MVISGCDDPMVVSGILVQLLLPFISPICASPYFKQNLFEINK